MGIADRFIQHGKRDLLLKKLGLLANDIATRAAAMTESQPSLLNVRTG
jgi:deoxyxylulose-5-phosphate synthase